MWWRLGYGIRIARQRHIKTLEFKIIIKKTYCNIKNIYVRVHLENKDAPSVHIKKKLFSYKQSKIDNGMKKVGALIPAT